MAPSQARPAATLILVRHGGRHRETGLETLMVRRNPGARFMPGVWVFPGGAVNDLDRARAGGDDPDEAAHRSCVRRELAEEARIEIAAEAELLPWSRWITPEVVPVRFDTRFYVALAPAHAKPEPDREEVTEAEWIGPADALARSESGDFELAFPTLKHLEGLVDYETADEVVAAARERHVEPILPRVAGTRDEFRILLPGDPEY
jgi:8-oxo-dGTP pyrophosphatase MutT (NUDIX family)